jgi:hypothetical protein
MRMRKQDEEDEEDEKEMQALCVGGPSAWAGPLRGQALCVGGPSAWAGPLRGRAGRKRADVKRMVDGSYPGNIRFSAFDAKVEWTRLGFKGMPVGAGQ